MSNSEFPPLVSKPPPSEFPPLDEFPPLTSAAAPLHKPTGGMGPPPARAKPAPGTLAARTAGNQAYYQVYCKQCDNAEPDVIENHAAGDLICRDCGLVLKERIVDERSEWRTFSNSSDSKSGGDPNRVGGPANPWLKDSGLSTMIAKTPDGVGGTSSVSNLARWQNRGSLSSSDRSLLNGFKHIATVADHIGLPQNVKDAAQLVFKQIEDLKALRGRSTEAIAAACVYIGCRKEGVPRTFKELVASCNVPKRDLGRVYKQILKVLETNLTTISSSDFMTRFCSNLKLPMPILKAATHVAREAVNKSYVAGRSPLSVSAAAIYMVTAISDEKRTTKEISDVVGVAEATIKRSYAEMYPHRNTLIPPSFTPTMSIEDLPPP